MGYSLPGHEDTQEFKACLRDALRALIDSANPGFPTAQKVISALEPDAREVPDISRQTFAANRYFEGALAGACDGPASIVRLAAVLQRLEPSLQWYRRSGDRHAEAAFLEGHANALIIGPAGLVSVPDLVVGVSLLAPHISYPAHRHPPQELYLVLSAGQWRQNDEDWWEPGVGGVVYNASNVQHAMRSGARPLLAVWCLSGTVSPSANI
jgi:quercetin dioxygenase-like cupin family protein